jgi:choline-sulfatase
MRGSIPATPRDRPAFGWLASLGLLPVALLSACASTSPAHRSPNVVVIIADSLRCDRLRLYNPADGVAAPAIEGLAAHGVVFRNAWTVTPWTAPSVVSIFTGLYPPSLGVVFRDDTTPDDLPTLPRLLAARGYRLGNFAFFSELSYFSHLGFPPPAPGTGHDGGEGFARFASGSRPFLAWVHLVETHLPYGATGYAAPAVRVHGSSGLELAQTRAEVPVGSVEFAPGDAERLRALYDEDVAALDRSVGAVVTALAREDILDDTIVVLVADHGEELLDHGWIGHASTSLEAKLVPEILHVPLIIAGPGVPPGASSDALVQHVDILPTLLGLLRVRPPRPLDGAPLLPLGAHAARTLVYFDTSTGGNLTPESRRGERLQGASDGRMLLASRTGAGAAEAEELTSLAPSQPQIGGQAAERARLAAALEAWRRHQAAQRLALLRGRHPAGMPTEVESFSTGIAVRSPRAGEVLERAATGGEIVLEWDATHPAVLIEYSVGHGVRRVAGHFGASGSRLVFGPFPPGFWDEVGRHGPFRFRVIDAARRLRSQWVEFSLAAVASR